MTMLAKSLKKGPTSTEARDPEDPRQCDSERSVRSRQEPLQARNWLEESVVPHCQYVAAQTSPEVIEAKLTEKMNATRRARLESQLEIAKLDVKFPRVNIMSFLRMTGADGLPLFGLFPLGGPVTRCRRLVVATPILDRATVPGGKTKIRSSNVNIMKLASFPAVIADDDPGSDHRYHEFRWTAELAGVLPENVVSALRLDDLFAASHRPAARSRVARRLWKTGCGGRIIPYLAAPAEWQKTVITRAADPLLFLCRLDSNSNLLQAWYDNSIGPFDLEAPAEVATK